MSAEELDYRDYNDCFDMRYIDPKLSDGFFSDQFAKIYFQEPTVNVLTETPMTEHGPLSRIVEIDIATGKMHGGMREAELPPVIIKLPMTMVEEIEKYVKDMPGLFPELEIDAVNIPYNQYDKDDIDYKLENFFSYQGFVIIDPTGRFLQQVGKQTKLLSVENKIQEDHDKLCDLKHNFEEFFFCVRELTEEALQQFRRFKKKVIWMRFNPTHAMSFNLVKSEEVTNKGIEGMRHHYGNEEKFFFPFHVDDWIIHSEQWSAVLMDQEMSERMGYDMIGNFPFNQVLKLKERQLRSINCVIEGLRVIEMPEFPYSALGHGGEVDRKIKDKMISPCSRVEVKVEGDCYTRTKVRLKDGKYELRGEEFSMYTRGKFLSYSRVPGVAVVYEKDDKGEVTMVEVPARIMETPTDGENCLVFPLNNIPLNMALGYKETIMDFVYSWIVLPDEMHRAIDIEDMPSDKWDELEEEVIVEPIDHRPRFFNVN
jgi:hypothetical protein